MTESTVPQPSFTLGVDLGKDALVACLLDGRGGEVKPPTEFKTTPAGLRKLVKWMVEPARTRVVFESTGVYGKRLIIALDHIVASLHQLNPKIVKRRAATSIQTKTDHADARAIARVGHDLALTQPEVLLHATVRFDPLMEDLALWLAEFQRVSSTVSTLKVQIQTVECNPAPAAKAILARMRRELAQAERRKEEVCELMEAATVRADAAREKLLRSIPGIGPVGAAALLCKVGDVRRFESADALKGYLGIYPRRIQSGKHEARSRMATHGSDAVRSALWNCAKSASKCNGRCVALYERLSAAGKHAASCYGAVCRLLVQLVYGVLKSHQPFREISPAT